MAAHTISREPARRSIVAAIAIVGIMLLAIGSVKAATVTVAAVNFEFQPTSRTVREGDVVRWTFSGDPHTVTSGTPGAPDGRFDSGITDPGGSFQVTFETAGTFHYFCQIHSEQMFGTIVVSAGVTPTPNPTPTATPSPKPTVKPTAPPTAGPTVRPTPTPIPTDGATALPSTGPTTSPTVSSAGASAEPSAAAAPSSAPSLAPDDGDAGAIDPQPIIAGAIVIGLLLAGGLALARRSGHA